MYYIGSHWGDPTDGYVCSSKRMLRAIAARPMDFKRKIISIHSTKIDMLEAENYWLKMISKEQLGKKYYNLSRVTNHWQGQSEEKIKEVHQKIQAVKKGHQKKKERMVFNSPEYKQFMSKHTTAMWQDPEHRYKTGKAISAALKNKPRECTKGTFWWNNGYELKRSAECPGAEWVKGRGGLVNSAYVATEQTKQKMSAVAKERKQSEETKKKRAAAIKAFWSDPVNRQKMIDSQLRGHAEKIEWQ